MNAFYVDMYSHVDGELRELTRARAAQVFKPEVRGAVLKKPEDKPELGLLGGDEALAENLEAANKKDAVINRV